MAGNKGKTTLKAKWRNENPMQEFDRLPPELREWVSGAVLPWRAKSVKQAYEQAKSRTGSAHLALAELDRIQQKLIAKDVQRVWGGDHPQSDGPVNVANAA